MLNQLTFPFFPLVALFVLLLTLFAFLENAVRFFFMFSHFTFNKKRQKSRADLRKTPYL